MKIIYSKPKGQRIKRYGLGIEVNGMWFEEETKTWKRGAKPPFSNTVPCSTVRAFRRHIRKHKEIQEARWVCAFVGHQATITIRQEAGEGEEHEK